jgi:hypothetical protein
MSYRCQACSYRGRSDPSGACPGCGSLNIYRRGADESSTIDRNGPLRLTLLAGLWALLVGMIAWNLSS